MAVNEIRFARLGYVALNVSEMERSVAFYRDIVGLTCDAEPEGGHAFLRCSDRHHDVMLAEGGEPGLSSIGWEMESQEALEAAELHLRSIGQDVTEVSATEAAAFHFRRGFRSYEPTTGAVFEFYVDMEAAPAFEPTHTQIARLGHVVLNSVDRPATEAFLMDDLNFRISDRIDGMVTFMRCFPNPFHHSLGVGAGPKNGLNHVNFMVTSMDDIGKANNRMKHNQVDIVYGPGKHPPSESVFLYFLDPDGITVEYSYGMEEFSEAGAREPRDMPADLSSIDYWGGIPDPRMGKGGIIEQYNKQAG